MRCFPVQILLVIGLCIVLASIVWGQEETVPPEDSIEAPEEVSPTQGGRTQLEEEHTVVPGDTLWDLCAKYLNNPWYWPRVWSYNPEISNPHWIYPDAVGIKYRST